MKRGAALRDTPGRGIGSQHHFRQCGFRPVRDGMSLARHFSAGKSGKINVESRRDD